MRPFLLALLLVLAGCRPAVRPVREHGGPLRVVATTSLIGDLARQIGGPSVAVEALMGPGVDPHVYKASEGDVLRMADADLVLYHGLHLEGRMADLFERMNDLGWRTAAVTRTIPVDTLHHAPSMPGAHDPHVWFDVRLWQRCAQTVEDAFVALDPSQANAYRARGTAYRARLDTLDAWVRAEIARIPPPRRVLITAHDAFGYFGAAYGVRVVGLQGLSTATEAGTADVQRLANLLVTTGVPAVFVESSVSPRTIEAVVAAVRARGGQVRIGGSL
ncbi:MAG TPA: zinc ABC transporter substrate-binding protein, partial [Rhodothermales bacterium]|nr:zinc ABC transporter substrate-binding protein [Rhodothermales bacterium]